MAVARGKLGVMRFEGDSCSRRSVHDGSLDFPKAVSSKDGALSNPEILNQYS